MSNEMTGKQYEVYELHNKEYRLKKVDKGIIYMTYIGDATHITGLQIWSDGWVILEGDPRGNV